MIDKIQISVTTILDLIQEFDNTLRFGKPSLTNEQKENFINQLQRSISRSPPSYAWHIIDSVLLASHIKILNIPSEFEGFILFLEKIDIFVVLDQDINLERFKAII